MCVIVKPRRNEEAQAHIGLSNHTKKKKKNLHTHSTVEKFTFPREDKEEVDQYA
jgi:hypothetical protein